MGCGGTQLGLEQARDGEKLERPVRDEEGELLGGRGLFGAWDDASAQGVMAREDSPHFVSDVTVPVGEIVIDGMLSLDRDPQLDLDVDAHNVPMAKPAAKAEAPKKQKASSNGVNTRTPEGRAAYDAAVLSWLRENTSKSNPQPSSAVIKACGGTTLQARTTLNRLIEAGKANFVGKARATKYRAS